MGNWERTGSQINGKNTYYRPSSTHADYYELMFYHSGTARWTVILYERDYLRTSMPPGSNYSFGPGATATHAFPYTNYGGQTMTWFGGITVVPNYVPSAGATSVTVTGNHLQSDGGSYNLSGLWAHVAVVWDGSKLNLYKDGRIKGFADAPNINASILNSARAYLGGAPNSGTEPCINGAISDFRFYNKALSSSELINIVEGDRDEPVVSTAVPHNKAVVDTINIDFDNVDQPTLSNMDGVWYDAGEFNGRPYYKRLDVQGPQYTDKEFLSYYKGKWGFRTSLDEEVQGVFREPGNSRTEVGRGDLTPLQLEWEGQSDPVITLGGSAPHPSGANNLVNQNVTGSASVGRPVFDESGNSYFVDGDGKVQKIDSTGATTTLATLSGSFGSTATAFTPLLVGGNLYIPVNDESGTPNSVTLSKINNSTANQVLSVLDLTKSGVDSEFGGMTLNSSKSSVLVSVPNADGDIEIKSVNLNSFQLDSNFGTAGVSTLSSVDLGLGSGTGIGPIIDPSGNTWMVARNAGGDYEVVTLDPLGNVISPNITIDSSSTFGNSPTDPRLTIDPALETLYLVTRDGDPKDTLSAYDINTKTLNWKRDFGVGEQVIGSPAVSTSGPDAGTVYIALDTGELIGINQNTGLNKFGPADLGSAASTSPTVDSSGAVYVSNSSGQLSKFPSDLSTDTWADKGHSFPSGVTGLAVIGSKIGFGSGNNFVSIGSNDPTINTSFPSIANRTDLSGTTFGGVVFSSIPPAGKGFKYTATIAGVTYNVKELADGRLEFFNDSGEKIYTGSYNSLTGKLDLSPTPVGSGLGLTPIQESRTAGKIRKFKKTYTNLLKNGKFSTFRTHRGVRSLLDVGDEATLELGDGPSKISIGILQLPTELQLDSLGAVGGPYSLESIGDKASFNYKDYKYELEYVEEGSVVIDVSVFLSELPPVYLTTKNEGGDYWEESISDTLSAKRDGALFVHNGLFVTGEAEELYNLSEFVTGATKTLEDHTSELSTIATSPALIPPTMNTAEMHNISPAQDGMLIFNTESGKFAGYSSSDGGWNTFDWK
ncbi:MAG: hypothetical protein CME70_18440 [Halobacteriovorax sp.]|nr:hypothetical protein [Halobacteriovorax sp.]